MSALCSLAGMAEEHESVWKRAGKVRESEGSIASDTLAVDKDK
jgi:hypothetical protein